MKPTGTETSQEGQPTSLGEIGRQEGGKGLGGRDSCLSRDKVKAADTGDPPPLEEKKT